MQFSASELCDATNKYCRSNVVGRGGFGIVHRGVVRGTLQVAVKTLNQVYIYTCICTTVRASYLFLHCFSDMDVTRLVKMLC